MGFSRQEYWSGLPCPPPGIFPDPGIKPTSFISPALAGRFFTTSITWEVPRPLGERKMSPLLFSYNNPKRLRRDGKNTQKKCTKKSLNDLDNYDGVANRLEPDILEYEVKWAL